jgi:hypothetical protein
MSLKRPQRIGNLRHFLVEVKQIFPDIVFRAISDSNVDKPTFGYRSGIHPRDLTRITQAPSAGVSSRGCMTGECFCLCLEWSRTRIP